MAKHWPFFAATLANMEMVLAKSDIGIARRYAGLVEDEGLRDAIFGRIHDGWHRARDGLLTVTGQTRLLSDNPALEASIRLRLPYIEPLNLLQIELMKRPSRGRGRSAHRRRHPVVDQRHRHRVAQQRVKSSGGFRRSLRRRPALSCRPSRQWRDAGHGCVEGAGRAGENFSPSDLLSVSLGGCVLSIMAMAGRVAGLELAVRPRP